VDTLLTADPPRHTRFRKLVNLAFSVKRVDAIEAKMRGIAAGLLDAMLAKPGGDFVADFAVPFPVAVIAGEIGMTRAPMWRP
jgi:cytochrome P450